MYNLILNHEEDNISNFEEKIIDQESRLNLLEYYSKANEREVSPWEKYSTSLSEKDYISGIIEAFNFKLCFSTPIPS